MSRGTKLQEMEVKTQQSKTVVNANAAPADPMPKLTTGGTAPSYEDLGGPTPENSKPDDDSNKLKTPGATLKQVKDELIKVQQLLKQFLMKLKKGKKLLLKNLHKRKKLLQKNQNQFSVRKWQMQLKNQKKQQRKKK